MDNSKLLHEMDTMLLFLKCSTHFPCIFSKKKGILITEKLKYLDYTRQIYVL